MRSSLKERERDRDHVPSEEDAVDELDDQEVGGVRVVRGEGPRVRQPHRVREVVPEELKTAHYKEKRVRTPFRMNSFFFFSSHLVASIDNLLVFSLLRAKMGEREREGGRERESRKWALTSLPLPPHRALDDRCWMEK